MRGRGAADSGEIFSSRGHWDGGVDCEARRTYEDGEVVMKKQKPVVGLIMGSKSDWPTMEQAAKLLDEFGVAYEAEVVSAHRTPGKMIDYALSAEERGLKLVIAGAGGAAHLPGMVASMTALLVLGVPVRSKQMDGLDSLLSIAQMPAGV